MREAIERVIADLEQESRQNSIRADMEGSPRLKALYIGYTLAFTESANKLREAIEAETNNSNSPNGNGTHDSGDGKADQVATLREG